MRAQICQKCLAPSKLLLLHNTNTTASPLIRRALPTITAGRTFFTVFRKTTVEKDGEVHPPLPSELASLSDHSLYERLEGTRVLLKPNNLFHPMDESPSPSMRERAANIKRTAYCPHPHHRAAGSPTHIRFTCPDCGIPAYCSEEHWAEDYRNHMLICDALREANEDDHDLRSGRFFPEFEYPGEQMDEALINFTNWDTLLYTRDYKAINDERSLRQVTKLLTYPITVASFVHELSPYDMRHRLTVEGLKSVSALRYTLHPPRVGAGKDIKGIRVTPPPVRLFILGARSESSLPREVWHQLTHMFPLSTFHLVFIGPQSMMNRDAELPLPDRTPANPFGAVVERVSHSMKISTFVEYYHTLHDTGAFNPYDPYFDMFVLFHPGLGHPGSAAEWESTLPRLLDTKCAILCTGYTEEDMNRDIDWVHDKCKGEFDVLLEPGENRFRSLRWDINDGDPSELSQGNWGIWSFRGKRYEATKQDLETR
ncbi:zinc-finger of mitochondrial splicing suppressor 51-domain-containing protein [Tuber brumale]|nr:zinc-finger of mitochondrial splicing suppressor 51-domain-containing protein [Tuber brumale]